MLNRALKSFLPWFGCSPQGRYVRLLAWLLLRWGINLRCNLWSLEATVISIFSAKKRLKSSQLARSEELYTFLSWHHSQIPHGGTWATRLIWMLSIWFSCWIFDSIYEVIVVAIYSNLISIYSGCLNSGCGSCASLCIIDVSRDWILKNSLESNGTAQKTIKTINI